jgi:hypothetical protein
LSWRPTFGRVAVGRYCASVGFFRASNALALITSFGVRFSAVDSEGRTKWIADGHRGGGKRFVVRSDERQAAFLEREAAIRCQSREQFAFHDSSFREERH